MKKIISLLMIFALTFSIAGCGKKASEQSTFHSEQAYQSSYKTAENIPVTASNFQVVNDRVWFLVNSDESYIGSVKFDATDLQKINLSQPDGMRCTSMSIAPDGSPWIVMESDENESEPCTLIKLDASGAEQSRTPLDIQPYTIQADQANNVYVAGENGIIGVNPQGEKTFEIADDSLLTLSSGSEQTMLAAFYGDNGIEMKEIDWGKQGFTGETIEVDPGKMPRILTNGNDAYRFFMVSSDELLGCSLQNSQIESILTFSQIDIVSEQVRLVHPKGNDAFFCVTVSNDAVELHEITKATGTSDQTVMTLASFNLSPDIKQQIIEFNRTNSDYRIEILDYSQYNSSKDYTAGLTKLNTDIISGNTPDLIELSQVSYSNYASKGLLEDLNGFLSKDSDVSSDDLVKGAVNALSFNGGLYRIAPSFMTISLYGRESQIDSADSWNFEELKQLLDSHSEIKQPFANLLQAQTLHYLCLLTMNQFIDESSGKCSFDSEDFINLLEIANRNKTDSQDGYTEPAELLLNNESLLSLSFLSSVQNYQSVSDSLNGDLNFIGFPSAQGSGHIAEFQSSFAIFADSQYKDGAWAFIKTLLDEDFQNKLAEMETPVLQSAFDAALSEAQSSENPDIKPVSQEIAEQYRQIIDSITYSSNFDGDLMGIINEEAETFFDGRRSAKETADAIQSRAQLYISESLG